MKPYAPLACALALVALPGCDELLSTTVTFTDEAGAAVELEFDLTGDCNDVGERTCRSARRHSLDRDHDRRGRDRPVPHRRHLGRRPDQPGGDAARRGRRVRRRP